MGLNPHAAGPSDVTYNFICTENGMKKTLRIENLFYNRQIKYKELS
jgi:hypothetical protein